MSDHPTPLLTCCELTRTYRTGNNTVHALTDVSLTIQRGQLLAIEGPSGAGKSTLLHLLGLLDTPDRGTIHLDGRSVHDLPDPDKTRLRLHRIGFVTAHFDLLPELDATENVAVPAILSGASRRRALAAAQTLVERVGLACRATHRPGELSGGEQQRIAIARALINDPDLILADEPTGRLDTHTSDQILELLRALTNNDVGVVLATHNARASAHADRTTRLLDGRIPGPSPSSRGTMGSCGE